MTVAHGSTFADPGASATDEVDGDADVTVTGSVDTSTVGTYTLTYSATDTAGNTAEANRTVSVTDQTIPAIILNGSNVVKITKGDSFADPGAIVSDNVDANRTITGTGAVDTTTPGTYVLTYEAQDAAGNEASSVTRTIIVRGLPFVITVKTNNDGDTNDTAFEIPTHSDTSLSYLYDVDCDNDGTDEAADVSSNYICSYDTAGTYTVAIYGDFPAIYFNDEKDRQKILTVEAWGDTNWKTFENAFYNCSHLIIQAADMPNLSQVEDMSRAFAGISNITSDINGWETEHVTSMAFLFYGVSAFNQNISGWNTGHVTTMGYMFASAGAFDQNISTWDTHNVEDMTGMFMSAHSFDCNLGDWNISNTGSFLWMFSDVTLSVANYDAILNGWAAQSVHPDRQFHGGNSRYSNAGKDAHDTLTNPLENNWTITDGGLDAPPVITLNGDNPMLVVQDSTFEDPGATAVDAVDGDVNVSVSGSVDTAVLGDYNLTYQAIDSIGNVAESNRTVTVVERGDPVAHSDTFVTNFETVLNGDLSLNDTLSTDGTNTYVEVDAPAHGALTLEDNGTFSYTPAPGYFGEDTFTYKITDDDGESDVVSVTITVRGRPFIITVKTNNGGDTNDTAFEIPTHPDISLTYRYDIDCNNDGTDEATAVSGNYVCSYDAADTYTVAIRGDFPAIYFNLEKDMKKILAVKAWGDTAWETFEEAFYGCSNMTIQAADAPDLSRVTNMADAFGDIGGITSDINGWETGHITNMSYTFTGVENFNQDISDWNTSSVTEMTGMFWGAKAFDQDIGDWNTSQVTSMRFMFKDTEDFDQDIGGWDITQITGTGLVDMFEDAALSTTNYDALLTGWAAQSVQDGLTFDAGDSNCTASSDAETARDSLVNNHGWTITDGSGTHEP
jgi:surface protein